MNTELFIESRREYQRKYMKARRAGEDSLEVRAKEKEYNAKYRSTVGDEDYICRCGSGCKERSKYSHFTSKYHLAWVEANPDAEQEYQDSQIKPPAHIRRFDKVACECGAVMIRNNLSKHKKSNQHQAWVKETQIDPLEEEADAIKHLDDEAPEEQEKCIVCDY